MSAARWAPCWPLRDQCAAGIKLAAKVLGAANSAVLVYKHISDSEVAIPRSIGGIPIKRVGGKYPAQHHIEEELEEQYKDENGWRCWVPGAMIHLYRAAAEGRPQTTTFVTVAGNCIGFPRNVEAPLGAPGLGAD